MFDFSFLAPCPSSGLIVQGDRDEVVPIEAVDKLVKKLSHQRDITITYSIVKGSDHFFTNRIDELTGHVEAYLTARLPATIAASAR